MYKLDKKLPWFTDISKVSENIYINAVSSDNSDDTNPNGLFSGFISEDTFYTSRWSNALGIFENFTFPIKQIDKYLFIEYLFSDTGGAPTEESVQKEKPKAFSTDSLEELIEKWRQGLPDSGRTSRPLYPYEDDRYKSNPYDKFADYPRMILKSEEFKNLQKQFQNILSNGQ